ncbi:minichromosome maintenance complex component 5 [Tanacetum coccineum]
METCFSYKMNLAAMNVWFKNSSVEGCALIEHAAYLAKSQGLSVTDAVMDVLNKSSYNRAFCTKFDCLQLLQPGEMACLIDPWIVVLDKGKYVDQQTLKLQENPEDVPTGELQRNMLQSVDRHIVQTIVHGTRLTIMGIYSIFQAAKSSTSNKSTIAVRQPHIRVVGIEETNEATRGPANFTTEEVF